MILYHMSPAINLEKIMDQGIKRGSMNCIFACGNPADCLKFAVAHFVSNAVIFGFFVPNEYVTESFDHNPVYFQCKCYAISKDIPPSKIFNYTLYDIDEMVSQIEEEMANGNN